MFFVREREFNAFGSQLLGGDHRCYQSVSVPGRLPFFMIEIPSPEAETETASILNPVLVSGLHEVRSTLLTIRKSLRDIDVTMIYIDINKQDSDWECGRLESVSVGTFQLDCEDDSIVTSYKVNLTDGRIVYWLGCKPNKEQAVDWTIYID